MRHPPMRTMLPMAAGRGSFVRGFVATGCLSAIQGLHDAQDLKRLLRHALQGGAALAAGTRAAVAIERRQYMDALLSAALGAAGVLVIEQLLRDAAQNSQENGDGKEEA